MAPITYTLPTPAENAKAAHTRTARHNKMAWYDHSCGACGKPVSTCEWVFVAADLTTFLTAEAGAADPEARIVPIGANCFKKLGKEYRINGKLWTAQKVKMLAPTFPQGFKYPWER